MAVFNPLHEDNPEDAPIKKQKGTPNDHPDTIAIGATPTGDQQKMRPVANWKLPNDAAVNNGVDRSYPL